MIDLTPHPQRLNIALHHPHLDLEGFRRFITDLKTGAASRAIPHPQRNRILHAQR